jgi:AMMECR1 domain-containing protein
MSNIVATFVIYHTLFQKKLLEDDNIIIKKLPIDAFGIFTTIRQSHKLDKWPYDIHGCIGNWDNNFNALTQKDLYHTLLRVSNDAMFNDNRKDYFPDIKLDPESYIELDFMLNPVYPIDKNNGMMKNKLFNNKEYGIIIQNNNKRATYLPDVFPNESWTNILESIKNKAGISSDFSVYAYKIKQIKTTFMSLLTEKLFGLYNIYKFAKLLFETMKPELKYPIIYEGSYNVYKWNQDDQVRNISILMDLIKYTKILPIITNKKNIIMEKITYILNNINLYSSQALSFLGELAGKEYCKKLLLDLPNSERDFAYNEIIIGLKKANCGLEWMNPTFTLKDSIFKINWIIQVYASYKKIISKELFNIFLQKIDEIIEYETNYIAVAFEAFCFIYKHYPNNKIFLLLCELEKRKNFFYEFLDKSYRIDITAHVMNGYFQLLN